MAYLITCHYYVGTGNTETDTQERRSVGVLKNEDLKTARILVNILRSLYQDHLRKTSVNGRVFSQPVFDMVPVKVGDGVELLQDAQSWLDDCFKEENGT